MKILVVFPKETHVTRDVAIGIMEGLERSGHTPIGYDLGTYYMYEKLAASVMEEKGLWKKMFGDEEYDDKTICDTIAQSTVYMALETKCDLVLVIRGDAMWNYRIPRLISKLGVKTAIWITEEPYLHNESVMMSQFYDIVFSNDKGSTLFQILPNVHYLPLGFREQFHRPMPVQRQYDFAFLGTMFGNRVRFFEELMPTLKGRKLFLAYHYWSRLDLESPVRKLAHPLWSGKVIPQEEAVKVYNQSLINLNFHRDDFDEGMRAATPGPRLFELAGCGAFQLVDNTREGIWDFFEKDEIVTFSDVEDCKSKMEYYLKNRSEVRRIGEKARNRALSNSTYTHRARSLVEAASGYFGG